jgi:hypothetical protein
MIAIYLFGFRRSIEPPWAERIKLLRKLSGQIVVATEQTLQHAFNNEDSLIPAPDKNGRGSPTTRLVSIT